jgi:hypothetical protein
VPAGNPGDIRFEITSAPTGATLSYSGSQTGVVTDGLVVPGYAHGDTLTITLSGAATSATVQVYDQTTGVQISTNSTLTLS